MSVRWQHRIDHADTKQKPEVVPDCLLGVVPQPTDSRLSETKWRQVQQPADGGFGPNHYSKMGCEVIAAALQ